MTVSSTVARANYACDGITTTYPIPFRFLDATHVRAVLTAANGDEQTLTLGTHYSVTGIDQDAGGSLVTTTPFATGNTLSLLRNMAIEQPVDYVPNDPFPAETHEKALDRLTMIAQQLAERQARTLGIAIGDSAVAELAALPRLLERSGRVLGFDDAGQPTVGPSMVDLKALMAAVLAPELAQLGANVSFLPRGDNTYGRSIEEKARERVSLLDFIPKDLHATILAGPNLIDVSGYVQKAIDDGRPLDAVGGYYYCADRIFLALDDIDIRGPGTFAWPDALWVGGAFEIIAHIRRPHIIGLTFELLANTTGNSFNAIYSRPATGSASDYAICGNDIVGFALGINIEGNDLGTDGPTALAKAAFASFGWLEPYMDSARASRGEISGNRIRNTWSEARVGSGGGHAIYARGSGYTRILNNHIENMQGGVLSLSNGIIAGNIILNCWEDNGIYCASGHRILVFGNYIENTKADGVAFSGTLGGLATGNIIVNASNGFFRVQSVQSVSIKGNLLICTNKRSGHYLRDFGIDGAKANANVLFEGNVCWGQVKATPVSFTAGNASTQLSSIKILNNSFDGVDTTALATPFYGPYAIINVRQAHATLPNLDIVVRGNTFREVVEAPRHSTGRYMYIIGATVEQDNTVIHAPGFTTRQVIDTHHENRRGTLRTSLDAAGAPGTVAARGIVQSIAKDSATGTYLITFNGEYPIDEFSWSAAGSNAPFHVRWSPLGTGTSDDYVTSVTVTIYDATHAPYWPASNCTLNLAFGFGRGILGI